jgi:hypothetical protein
MHQHRLCSVLTWTQLLPVLCRHITENTRERRVAYNLDTASNRVQESISLPLQQLLQVMQEAGCAIPDSLVQWQKCIKQQLGVDADVAVCRVPAGKQAKPSAEAGGELAVMLPMWSALLGRAPLQNSHYDAGEAVAAGRMADDGLWACLLEQLDLQQGLGRGTVAIVQRLDRSSVGLAFSRTQLQQTFTSTGLINILPTSSGLAVVSPSDLLPPHLLV